jgi:uncharacterized surface protein with fasciclin (FAS1) repeats
LFPRPLFAVAAVLAPLTVLAQTAAAPTATTPAPAAATAPSTTTTAPTTSAPTPGAAGATTAPAVSPDLVPNGSIASTLKSSNHFTILSKALDQAQLTAVLNSTPGLTLFAPTDEAFKSLPPGELAKLLQPDNAPTLQKILIYHLVNMSLDSSKIKGSKGPVPSVEKSELRLDGSSEPMKVNDADIVEPNVKATNGIIHVVDKVLIPPDVTLPAAG